MKKVANDKPREYSCVMVGVPQNIQDAVLKWSYSAIPDSIVYDEDGFGRELKTHVTVKYGLHTDDASEVMGKLPNKAIEFKIGNTDLFTGAEDYDVLILKVDCPALEQLNAELSEAFECTDAHPNYIPHMTIAYLKKGAGEKFRKMTVLPDSEKAKFSSIIFSDSRGNKTERALI